MKKIIPLLLSMIFIASCGGYYSSIHIENRSGNNINEIVISARELRREYSAIPPNSTKSISIHLPGEAVSGAEAPRISYSIDGRLFQTELCYYTGSMPMRAFVIIEETGANVTCHN